MYGDCDYPWRLSEAADLVDRVAGETHRARELELRAASIEEVNHTRAFVSVSSHLYNAGYYAEKMGELNGGPNTAKPLFEEALEIVDDCLGRRSPRWAMRATATASLYRRLGLRAECSKLAREAMRILVKAYGPRHSETAECLALLKSV
jgi:hypothetical protein